MAKLDLLMRSLEFIEEHLEDTVAVQTEDIVAACFASKSGPVQGVHIKIAGLYTI